MKQRFSSIDIKVIAHELSSALTTLRVSNIYDLSSRIFLFKFSKPNHREQLVLDTGFRCHLTKFARTTAGEPSAFVAKLRKFLKTRRVTSVSQIGTDRILEIQFSNGEYRLFLEFYASGNLVLTDRELKVLALFRIVREGSEIEKIRPGSTYNLSQRQNVDGVPPLTEERLKNGLKAYVEKTAANSENAQWNKKSKKKSGDALRKAIASCTHEFPPVLIEHVLHVKGFDLRITPEEVLEDSAKLSVVSEALLEATRIMDSVLQPTQVKGYIICKVKDGKATPAVDAEAEQPENTDITEQRAKLLYNDFHPFKPNQFENESDTRILEFDGYNLTVDEFFSSIEGQKLESRLQEKEDAAKRKIENAHKIQEGRIEELQATQTLNIRKAQAIEANLERVTEAAAAINGLIANGMDWGNINSLIELEQKKNNPVAEMIKLPLNLNENTATLLLNEWDSAEIEEDGDVTDSEPSFSDDEEEEEEEEEKSSASTDSKKLAVEFDLGLSAWSNARDYYDQKRTAAAKEEKTAQASSKALKNAKQKIDADLKRALKQETHSLRPLRQQMWFEKYIFFISSDGYLVLGGNDAMQCDLLYKRHFKPGDIYVCADIDGATSVFIQNTRNSPDAPIPPSTLSQAGNLAVATSKAWESKAMMSAWWATADQVSKTTPTGDYLDPGHFYMKGEKNFLPPAQLLLGFAVMFRVSEASKINHNRHRVQAPPDPLANRDVAGQTAVNNSNKESNLPDDQDEKVSDGEEEESGSVIGFEKPNEEEEEEGEEDTYGFNPLQPEGNGDLGQDDESVVDVSEMADDEVGPLDSKDDSGNNLDDEEDDQSAEEPQESEHKAASEPIHSDQTGKQALPVRGKRGKRKKMLQKYADQDEEDREAAMRLLGSRTGQERAKQEEQAKVEKREELAAQKQRRREQHLKREREGKALDAKRQARMENGETQDDDDDLAQAETLVDLDTLVGTPLPGDEILEALPVCAPWNALTRNKYKAKIQPGSQKKGKAVREITGKWLSDGKDKKKIDEQSQDVERIWPREIELLANWKEAEILNFLPVSKVKVMMAGASGGRDSKGGPSKGKPRGGKGPKKR